MEYLTLKRLSFELDQEDIPHSLFIVESRDDQITPECCIQYQFSVAIECENEDGEEEQELSIWIHPRFFGVVMSCDINLPGNKKLEAFLLSKHINDLDIPFKSRYSPTLHTITISCVDVLYSKMRVGTTGVALLKHMESFIRSFFRLYYDRFAN